MVQRGPAEAGTFVTHGNLPAVCQHASFQIYAAAFRRMLDGILHHIAESAKQMVFLYSGGTLQAVLAVQKTPAGLCKGICAQAKLVKHSGQSGIFKRFVRTG